MHKKRTIEENKHIGKFPKYIIGGRRYAYFKLFSSKLLL